MTSKLKAIREDSKTWANLQVEINYLESLYESEINSEQLDFVSGYVHHLNERIENFEAHLFEKDNNEGRYYLEVRNFANTLDIKPSKEFLDHLNSNLDEMDLDGIDFEIKKAVEEYNSFFYGCSISINDHGYVSFVGCNMESDGKNVLFNKSANSRSKKITVEDVKRKIAEINK